MTIIILIIILSLIVIFFITLAIINLKRNVEKKRFCEEYNNIVANITYLRACQREDWWDDFAEDTLRDFESRFMNLFN